MSLISAN